MYRATLLGNFVKVVKIIFSVGVFCLVFRVSIVTSDCKFNLVSSTLYTVCATKLDDSSIRCWGRSDLIGIAYIGTVPNVTLKYLASGNQLTCGITKSNKTKCWGSYAGYGEMDIPNVKFSAIGVSFGRNCAIRAEDNVTQCWGNVPGWGPPPPDPLISIDGSYDFFCGITVADTVTCWTRTNYAPDGINPPPTGNNWAQISANANHACALRNDGTLTCWGDETFGSLDVPGGMLFDYVEAGTKYTCALTRGDRHLVCWGYRAPVEPSNVPLLSVTCSQSNNNYCVKYVNGSVECFGNDYDGGQLVVPTNCVNGIILLVIMGNENSAHGFDGWDYWYCRYYDWIAYYGDYRIGYHGNIYY
jgi:hypothetical protein